MQTKLQRTASFRDKRQVWFVRPNPSTAICTWWFSDLVIGRDVVSNKQDESRGGIVPKWFVNATFLSLALTKNFNFDCVWCISNRLVFVPRVVGSTFDWYGRTWLWFLTQNKLLHCSFVRPVIISSRAFLYVLNLQLHVVNTTAAH